MKVTTAHLAAIFVLLHAARSSAQLPSDPSEYGSWKTRAIANIDSRRSEGGTKARDALVWWVFITKPPSFGSRSEQEDQIIEPVRRAASEALVSLADHAEYFRDSLEVHLKSEFSEASGGERLPTGEFSHRAHLFEIMAQLRSPQIVSILGELLEDERNPWKDSPRGDAGVPTANWFYATESLTKLGIEGVPIISMKGMQNREAAREQWRRWYAQVKAGNRTFRFKGNPQEYNLQGPLGAVIPEVALTERTATSTASPTVASEEAPVQRWPLWIALGVLVAGVAVYVGKSRAGRSGI